jgi:Domain of unknown function (DUF397)
MSSIDPNALNHLWRKARSSTGNGACVEVADLRHVVAVRDSKNPQGAILTYTATEWRSFLAEAKRGRFDTVS